MLQKVLFYLKSHYFGVLVSVLVLLAVVVGYFWGVAPSKLGMGDNITNIEQTIDDEDTSNSSETTNGSGSATVKTGTSVTNTGSNSTGKSVIINSEKIRPIPKDTKPADRPLYYFY